MQVLLAYAWPVDLSILLRLQSNITTALAQARINVRINHCRHPRKTETTRHEMYFLKRGLAEVLVRLDRRPVAKLNPGSSFGETKRSIVTIVAFGETKMFWVLL